MGATRGILEQPGGGLRGGVAGGQQGNIAKAVRATAAAEELFAAHGDVEGRAGAARCGDDLRAALKAADEEVRLRRTLAPQAQPDLATWELASGLSQRGRIRMVAGELESARYDLRDALDLAARLGPAGQGIVHEATLVLQRLGGL